jgi:hypothetical protein
MLVKVLLSILGAGYIISPIDGLPDLAPVLGQVDDLIILALVLYYVWGFNLWRYFLRGRSGRGAGANYYSSGGDGREEQGREESGAEKSRRPRDPREVLGVGADADPAEIKAAYRRVSQQYHPDKVSHLGPEFQELAQRKFVEIQEAYETLRRTGRGR